MAAFDVSSFEGLQSRRHSELLDVIDSLRSEGLSKVLPLPQLIVCGDQSSGKSSLLEAISGVPFPIKDNLCTRFATEVILRRDPRCTNTRASVTIGPGNDRTSQQEAELRKFQRDLDDIEDLPYVIEEAKDIMGLRSATSGILPTSAFSSDVLRLEVSGPRIPQLTIVDLPGLIHSETKQQTSQDVKLARTLVETYMRQPRTIILAVISAKNDYANQVVLKMARSIDPGGQRTMGIITKPDTIKPGHPDETSFMNLAMNKDIDLKLRWHVVCNLDIHAQSSQDISRDENERDYFKNSNWRSLDASLLGVENLRLRLSKVLFDQINHELPKLISDIDHGLVECQTRLQKLGKPRRTDDDKRQYLSEIFHSFSSLCQASCDGDYEHEWLSAPHDNSQEPRQIRAFMQNEGLLFAESMAKNGSRHPLPPSSEQGHIFGNVLARQEAVDLAKALLRNSRGRELPGTFNPLLIGPLFREYSADWARRAQSHVEKMWVHCRTFVELLLENVGGQDMSDLCFDKILNESMENLKVGAMARLDTFLEELKRHPITYDESFRNNYERVLQQRWQKTIRAQLSEAFSSKGGSLRVDELDFIMRFIRGPSKNDFDSAAAEDMVDYMLAYYKVALNRFVDYIPSLILEPCLLVELPKLLEPSMAWRMDAERVEALAGEEDATKLQRAQLEQRLKVLKTGEAICKRYASRSAPRTTQGQPDNNGSAVGGSVFAKPQTSSNSSAVGGSVPAKPQTSSNSSAVGGSVPTKSQTPPNSSAVGGGVSAKPQTSSLLFGNSPAKAATSSGSGPSPFANIVAATTPHSPFTLNSLPSNPSTEQHSAAGTTSAPAKPTPAQANGSFNLFSQREAPRMPMLFGNDVETPQSGPAKASNAPLLFGNKSAANR